MLRLVAVTALATLALMPNPSFAFYQDVMCERDTVTGEIEPILSGETSAKQWDYFRILAEKDVGLAPRPSPTHRPNRVFGMCIVEGHWSRIPEDAPIRFPRN
jgi:hypothetical protein